MKTSREGDRQTRALYKKIIKRNFEIGLEVVANSKGKSRLADKSACTYEDTHVISFIQGMTE